jgi:hypothetical protein
LKQREKISNLENAFQNLIHLPLTILQKDLEKNLQKDLQKQNMWCKCGANVVQNVKNKETIHAYLVSNIYWLNSKQSLHLHYAN